MNDEFGDEAAPGCQHPNLVLKQRLESLLNSRLEPFSLKMAALLPAQRKTYRVTRGEQGFRVHIIAGVDNSITLQKALQAELSAALEAIENAELLFPSVSLVEKLLLMCRRSLWRVMNAVISPVLQHRIVRILSGLQNMLAGSMKEANSYQRGRLEVISYLLQEPQLAVVNILSEHHFYLHWNYARRLRHLRNAESDYARNPQRFCWPERHAYVAMNRDCEDSRVLVTIHMGDFFGAFKCIADALDQSRAVISLRREGEIHSIKSLSRRHALGHHVFMHGKDNPLAIVKALRAGKQSLSVLFDLGGDFGETTEAIFFGHRARFVRGPAELAIMGRARIYPFVCFSEAGSDWINMEPAFFPELRVGESLQEAASRVTQSLVTMAERWIRQHPAQWKYLDILPSYLVSDNAGKEQEAAPDAG